MARQAGDRRHRRRFPVSGVSGQKIRREEAEKLKSWEDERVQKDESGETLKRRTRETEIRRNREKGNGITDRKAATSRSYWLFVISFQLKPREVEFRFLLRHSTFCGVFNYQL
jgi:hypothetical protein